MANKAITKETFCIQNMQTAAQASAQKDIQIHAHTLTRTQYNSHLLTCTRTPTPPRTAYTETAHGSARTYAQRTQ